MKVSSKKNQTLPATPEEITKMVEHIAQSLGVSPFAIPPTLESVDLSNVDPVTLEKLKEYEKQIDELYKCILENQKNFGNVMILPPED